MGEGDWVIGWRRGLVWFPAVDPTAYLCSSVVGERCLALDESTELDARVSRRRAAGQVSSAQCHYTRFWEIRTLVLSIDDILLFRQRRVFYLHQQLPTF